jgi:hypothetical protein
MKADKNESFARAFQKRFETFKEKREGKEHETKKIELPAS